MSSVERDAEIEESVLVDLLQRAQQTHDPAAYDGIYLLYADRVFRYLVVRLGDADQAEEITSQVFLHLVERLSKYNIAPADNVAIFSAWLYRMTYNKMVDILRRERRVSQLPIEHAEQIPTRHSETDSVIARLDFEQLLGTLAMLNEAQQQVILFRFIEELSIAETALTMEKTEGAVKALQHRALENLRRLLTD
ncbi:MAG: sigma-70 family RNA polymerase sigma factor [Caldilineaceae bacterium]|nr:sigma-70 family RNA polymerase sigma factor [Caldilineaceae bacterium]